MDQLAQYFEFQMQQSQLDTTMNSEGQTSTKKRISREKIFQVLSSLQQLQKEGAIDQKTLMTAIKNIIKIQDQTELRNSLCFSIAQVKLELKQQKQVIFATHRLWEKKFQSIILNTDQKIQKKKKEQERDINCQKIKKEEEKIQKLIKLLNKLMKLYKIRLIYTNEDIERLMQSMETYSDKIFQIQTLCTHIRKKIANILNMSDDHKIWPQNISNIIGLIILFYRNKDAQNLKENWEEDVFYYYCKTLNIMKGKKELKIECEEEIQKLYKKYGILSQYEDNNYELYGTGIDLKTIIREIVQYFNDSVEKTHEISWEIFKEDIYTYKNDFFSLQVILDQNNKKSFGWWLLTSSIDKNYYVNSKAQLTNLLNLNYRAITRISDQIAKFLIKSNRKRI